MSMGPSDPARSVKQPDNSTRPITLQEEGEFGRQVGSIADESIPTVARAG